MDLWLPSSCRWSSLWRAAAAAAGLLRLRWDLCWSALRLLCTRRLLSPWCACRRRDQSIAAEAMSTCHVCKQLTALAIGVPPGALQQLLVGWRVPDPLRSPTAAAVAALCCGRLLRRSWAGGMGSVALRPHWRLSQLLWTPPAPCQVARADGHGKLVGSAQPCKLRLCP